MIRLELGAGRCAFALLAASILVTGRAVAQGADDEQAVREGPRQASASLLARTVLPFTMAPSSGPVYGIVTSGYDGARNVVVYNAYADANVYGGLSIRAGYASPDLTGQASALFGPRLQLLQQTRHGVDLGIALFYMPQNIDGEGLLMGKVALGRAFGPLQLLAHVAYGQDPEGDDHQAEAAAATLYRLSEGCFVGFDARVRALVASSDEKHAKSGEPLLDLAVGPLATYRFGMFALVTQLGASALWIDQKGLANPRTESTVGAFGLLGASLTL